jgi:hypothetical protein
LPPCAWCGESPETTVEVEAEREDKKRYPPRIVPACGPCAARVKRDGPIGMPLRRKARDVEQLGMFPKPPRSAVIGS